MSTDTTAPKPFVFVLMPFNKAFDDIYKFGIKAAAIEAGAYAERVDEQNFAEGMLDRIFNQINKADVVVADMSGRNPNVFYEVGYAHALNKLVLLLTKKAKDIPFDLKHRPHTVYGSSIETLKTKLVERLKWAINEARTRNVRSVPTSSFVVLTRGKKLIPERSAGLPIPEVLFTVTQTAIGLYMQVRNDGPILSDTIHHIYLLAERDAAYKPIVYPLPPGELEALASYLPQLIVSASDSAALGLPVQYRVQQNLPGIPPGASELITVKLRADTFVESSGRYCLRLHESTRTHDFPFTVRVRKKPA